MISLPRKRFAIGALAALVLATLAFVVRPHVVRHWALYLGTPGAAGERLFLDPFPDRASCQTRVAAFLDNHEPAFCRSRLDLEVGTSEDAILAADFGFFSPQNWFCAPRRHDSRRSVP